MILGDVFSWYAVLRFPNDIYSMAVSSLKECLVDCGWLGDDSPITMTVVQQLLRTFSVRSMPGATEVFFGTFVELLNAISLMEVQGVSAARSYKSNSIAIVLKNYMSRKQSSSISRTALNAQSRRVLSYFVTFVEERIVPKAWKRNPVPRHVFMQVGKLDRSILRVLQTLFMNFANRTSNDGGMYSVASKDSVMSWEQFLMFTEIVGLIKSQLIHVSDVAEVFVSTSRPIYRLVDEKTHLKMIRDRLRRNGRREGSWNDRTRSDDTSSSYVRKFGSRIVLTRERELTFDGFVEALIRLSVPVQARSSSSESRDEFQHFHRRQDILHKHADAIKHVPVMDRMRTVLVIVSSYLIKSGHRQRTRQSRLYDFPDVSLSEIGHRLMKLIE